MDDPRRTQGAGDHPPPGRDTTAAGAFAPPPGSGRSVATFTAALVLVVCGVTGVLSFFTEIPVVHRILLLGAAVLAAVAVVLLRRRPR